MAEKSFPVERDLECYSLSLSLSAEMRALKCHFILELIDMFGLVGSL